MKIKGFEEYLYSDGIIYKKGKPITIITRKDNGQKICKMKDNDGKWRSLAYHTVLGLAGIRYDVSNFKPIPRTDEKYFINEVGKIISFKKYECGIEMSVIYQEDKYPKCKIVYDNKPRVMNVHSLIAITFLDEDYVSKGLVCLHLDNNKDNHTLDNLKIGTYSENNKQAYTDGLNCGNKK